MWQCWRVCASWKWEGLAERCASSPWCWCSRSLMSLTTMKIICVMMITMMLMCIVYVDQGGTVTKRLLNDFPVPPRKLTNQLFSVISALGPWEKMRFPHFFPFSYPGNQIIFLQLCPLFVCFFSLQLRRPKYLGDFSLMVLSQKDQWNLSSIRGRRILKILVRIKQI